MSGTPLLSPKELATQFHKNKIVELKETQLSSGKKSPYYMDMRGLLAFPTLMTDLVSKLADRIQAETPEFDKIASVPVGAVPFASMLADRLGKPSVLVRDQPKQHGTKKLIEGRLGIDDRVILVEDVITTGASVLKTIQKLKNRGAEVVAVWSLLNREEGGLENIAYEYKDIPVYSLFTTSDIFGLLVKEKLIAAYDWERIKFFQESQFKDMIRQLRDRNTEKQVPEWESNRAQYFAARFPHWLALQPETPSNLILSLSGTRVLTPSQIVSLLAKNRVPVPLIHTGFTDICPTNLDQWNRETGGRVIYDCGTVLGWNTANNLLPELGVCNPVVIDKQGNQYKVAYEVATNHLLISTLADIDSAINTIRTHNETYANNGQRLKFVVVSFNETAAHDLINNDAIWAGLDKLVAEMTGNNLGCCGIAFKYSDMLLMSGRRDLWKRAPVCLCVDKWNLHTSMVSTEGVQADYHKSWADMIAVLDKLRPWQIMMGEDVISSPFPLIDRIGQYSLFFKSNQLCELVAEIRNKIYSQEAKDNQPLAEMIANCQQCYKVAVRQLGVYRTEPSKLIICGQQQDPVVNNNPSKLKVSGTANQLCQGVYQFCRDSVVWGYNFANDLIIAQKQIAEQRKKAASKNNKVD
jgi:orotate phosphoribosyltransferase